jgi:hypothetical protein
MNLDASKLKTILLYMCTKHLLLLIIRVMNVQLNDNVDVFKWTLHQNGLFYSLSLYDINKQWDSPNKQDSLKNEDTFEN